MRFGAIDAGSNALRVVVAEVAPGNDIRRLASERIPVRLGHGAFTIGELDAHTIDAAVEAFKRFRALFDEYGVERYRAVATSALRTSRNRDTVVHRLFAEAGINLEVITGAEEARLVRKAVRRSYRNRATPMTILDLGGGSLEVNVRNVSAWSAATLPIGTVRLIETLNLSGAVGSDEAAMIRRYVTTLLHTFVRDADGRNFGPAAACGGNAERYASLLGGKRADTIDVGALDAMLPEVLASDVSTRMQRWNVRRDRAETMAVAGLVLSTVAAELRLEQLLVPRVGIRDALLLELAETVSGDDHSADEARAKAVLSAARMFAARVGHDLTHGEQVRRLSRALFDQLEPLHQLPAELANLLEIAAVLHDVGEVLHGRSHHKHGEYMVLNARIPGLESPAKEMVAVLVRCHRKSVPNEKKHATYAGLSEPQQRQVRALLALLRVADALDTGHRQTVRSVTADRKGSTVTLEVAMRNGSELPPRRKTEVFEQEFRCALQLARAR